VNFYLYRTWRIIFFTYILDAVKLNAPELGEKITKALPKKQING